jgi:hypothetical protein
MALECLARRGDEDVWLVGDRGRNLGFILDAGRGVMFSGWALSLLERDERWCPLEDPVARREAHERFMTLHAQGLLRVDPGNGQDPWLVGARSRAGRTS